MIGDNPAAKLRRLQQQADSLRGHMYEVRSSAAIGHTASALARVQLQLADAMAQIGQAQGRRGAVESAPFEVCAGVFVEVAVKSVVATSTATLLPLDGEDDERANLVRYTLRCTGEGVTRGPRLRLTSVVEGYSAPAIDTLEPSDGDVVFQLPAFSIDRLKGVTEHAAAALRVRIDRLDDGAPRILWEQTFPLSLLARNVAFCARERFDGTLVPFPDWLGTFVTPSAPAVHVALREASDFATIGGYTSSGPVDPQVKAIYRALKARKIAFINTTFAIGAPADFSQRVRLPRETLDERAGNCVDATVLFASLIEAATINAALIQLPDHYLVAWQPRPDEDWKVLEATAMSFALDVSFEESQKLAAASLAKAASSQRFPLHDLRDKGIFPME